MRRALLGLVLVALIALAGCGPQEAPPDRTVTFIGGTGGLAASFVEGMPPVEVFDEGRHPFGVGLLIENLGEASVGMDTKNPYGYVELLGIDPEQFGKPAREMRLYFDELDLTMGHVRRTEDGTVIAGEPGMVTFNDLSYVNDRYGNAEYTIVANTCYDYRSYSYTEICIKDNLLERAQDDEICTLTGVKPTSTSGAPIQVTNVAQYPAGTSRIMITATIENLGNGRVFAPSWYQGSTMYNDYLGPNACGASGGFNPNEGEVYVYVTLGNEVGVQGVRCQQFGNYNEGIVPMRNGAPGTFTCMIETLGEQGGRVFTTDLRIELAYAYQSRISTPVVVIDTNAGIAEPDFR